MTYTVVVRRDREGRYLVSAPALKGCHTWGETLPEALDMAREAITGYVAVLQEDGDPIPPDDPNVSVNMAETAEAFLYRLELKEAAVVA
jgi:predicted RNase H-like HicB family nuclease